MADVYDLTIIGAGPAGLAASIYALERKLKTVVVETGRPGGQLLTLYPDKHVYDYPSYPSILGKELALKMYEHAKEEGAEIILDTTIEKIVAREQKFALEAGNREFLTNSVILATGMGHYQPRKLGVPGETELVAKGIFYQRLPDKVVGKRIVVIGGGDTALETAVAATEKGATVTVIHRSPQFRALEKTVDKAKSLSIPLYTTAQVLAIQGDERVQHVEIVKNSGAKSLLSADLVVVCIGIELTNTFLDSLGIKTAKHAVEVDRDMQTSTEGIFACGDLVIPAGKYKRITIAVGSAATTVNGVYQFLKNPYWVKR